jgi:uncharacterized membrane protein YbhN (UPF0104 family)
VEDHPDAAVRGVEQDARADAAGSRAQPEKHLGMVVQRDVAYAASGRDEPDVARVSASRDEVSDWDLSADASGSVVGRRRGRSDNRRDSHDGGGERPLHVPILQHRGFDRRGAKTFVRHWVTAGVLRLLTHLLDQIRARLASRRLRRSLNVAFFLVTFGVAAVSAHHFVRAGWPLQGANLWLVAAAGGLFVLAYAFKACGWRRLFAYHERPGSHALAAAGGAAACTGIALPGRFDDVVRIAVVRRFRSSRVGIGAICLSLVLVGLVDSAAITPLASVAAGLTTASAGVRVGLALVAAAGIGAAVIVVGLPRLSRVERLERFRIARWLQEHSTCLRETTKAWLLVSVSWSLRALALFVLLAALGVGWSYGLALLFLCATAASTALPIAPAGAATQIGAGAAILWVAGVQKAHAINFALSAQALVIVAGGAVVLAAAAWEARLRVRPRAALVVR